MNIEEKSYQKITPATEGNYLTTYREGDDIKTYEGVKAMYTPADFDASSVREITPEEHQSYQKAKEQALQEETEQASAAGTEAGNGSDDQGTGDSATGAENATQNAGENMSANLSQSAGADASVSDISQNTGGHNLTSENAADISGGTADSSARYYTVKKGDSLMSISKAVYHTTAMIPEICNANQIENMDMIYEGQQLLLP